MEGPTVVTGGYLFSSLIKSGICVFFIVLVFVAIISAIAYVTTNLSKYVGNQLLDELLNRNYGVKTICFILSLTIIFALFLLYLIIF